MSRLIPAAIVLGLITAESAALARPPESLRIPELQAPGRSGPRGPYLLRQGRAITSGDTIYFGGTVWAPDSARWEAIPDSVWTFDSGVGSFLVESGRTYPGVDPYKRPGLHGAMEGWIGYDASIFEAAGFVRRVSSADPRWEGMPCVGAAAGLGGAYSYWVGVFAAEAESLGYAGGRGYGNSWHLCLEQAFPYSGGPIRLQFDYHVELEEDYDFLEVVMDTGGAQPTRILGFTGSGSAHVDTTLSGPPLPSGPKPVTLGFCLSSDTAWSDEDGGFLSDCGAFALDDIDLSGGMVHTTDFESGSDGWEVVRVDEFAGGDWSHLADLSDLPALPDTLGEPCSLADSVLVLFDPDAPPQMAHPLRQFGFAASPWIDLSRAGIPPEYTGRFIEFDAFTNLQVIEFVFGIGLFQWYPEPPAGDPGFPPGWKSPEIFLPLGFLPACRQRLRLDYSDFIPASAEEIRIALGVQSFCGFFGNCLGSSNPSPWFDNVRFGVHRENSIQNLIAMAAPGDTIVVPPGTYLGSDGFRDIDLRGKNLVLWAPAGPESTIIDCEGLGRGFEFSHGEDSTCVLDGFTVRNGDVTGLEPANGGGIYVAGSSPRIRNCVVENCRAETGGGIFASGWARIEHCEFRGNTALAQGGGAFLGGPGVVLGDCLVTGNLADLGGGVGATGGIALDCTVTGNTARRGGGTFLKSSGRVDGSHIAGNEAVSGGGVFLEAILTGSTHVRKSVITGNFAQNGGGISFLGVVGASADIAEIQETTVSGNSALLGGAAHVGTNARLDLIFSIAWGNAASGAGRELFVDTGCEIRTSCAAVDIAGSIGGSGAVIHDLNLVVEDPRFCSPASAELAPTAEGNYTLAAGSPCLPVLNPCGSLIGALGLGCSVVPVLPPPDDDDPDPVFLTAPGILAGPNPFVGDLSIHYLSPSATEPRIEIFSIDGRRIADYSVRPGSGTVLWHGQDAQGRRVASGVYLVRFTAGNLDVVRRVVLTR